MVGRRIAAGLLGALLVACANAPNGSVPAVPAPGSGATVSAVGDEVEVVRVIDGDTIVVALGGPTGTRVRLIGIDTPERGDCLYRAATERMRALIAGRRVRLVRDVSETDRYGRLLRYVYVGDVFVNAAMVEEGYASAATFPPDVAHAAEFVSLERAARAARRGLWAGGCPT